MPKENRKDKRTKSREEVLIIFLKHYWINFAFIFSNNHKMKQIISNLDEWLATSRASQCKSSLTLLSEKSNRKERERKPVKESEVTEAKLHLATSHSTDLATAQLT